MRASTLAEREREVIADLEELGDRDLQMQYILACARDVVELPASECDEAAKVPGCLSSVWVHLAADERGRLSLRVASDALIVRGLLGIITLIVDGAPMSEVRCWEERITACDALRRHLARRSEGVGAVIDRIKAFAEGASVSCRP